MQKAMLIIVRLIHVRMFYKFHTLAQSYIYIYIYDIYIYIYIYIIYVYIHVRSRVSMHALRHDPNKQNPRAKPSLREACAKKICMHDRTYISTYIYTDMYVHRLTESYSHGFYIHIYGHVCTQADRGFLQVRKAKV